MPESECLEDIKGARRRRVVTRCPGTVWTVHAETGFRRMSREGNLWRATMVQGVVSSCRILCVAARGTGSHVSGTPGLEGEVFVFSAWESC